MLHWKLLYTYYFNNSGSPYQILKTILRTQTSYILAPSDTFSFVLNIVEKYIFQISTNFFLKTPIKFRPKAHTKHVTGQKSLAFEVKNFSEFDK